MANDSEPVSPYKLKIKINGSEFEAEGQRVHVDADYQRFLDALKATSAAPEKKKDPAPTDPNNFSDFFGKPEKKEPAAPVDKALEDLKTRVFQERDGLTTLKLLPKATDRTQRDADALVLILWGYHLKGEDTVFAPTLMNAARISGLQLDRIDRVIDTNVAYITSSGTKRGRRYGLNNPGFEYAKQVATQALQ